MATTALLTVERKLSAAETLEHATEALAAHRAWMKRRAQNSVSPGPGPTLAQQGELSLREKRPATWAMGGAPPPNDAAAEARGESSQRKHSKSTVAPTTDFSLLVKAGGPPPEVKEAGAGERAGDHFYGNLQTEGATSEGRPHPLLPPRKTSNPGEQGPARKPGHPKKRSGSRSKVSPVSPDDFVRHRSVPTSPDVFIGQDDAERLDSNSNSAPSPAPVLSAWQSLSSLEGREAETRHNTREAASSDGTSGEGVEGGGEGKKERGEIGKDSLARKNDKVPLSSRNGEAKDLERTEAGNQEANVPTKETAGKGRRKMVSRNSGETFPTNDDVRRGGNHMAATLNGMRAGGPVTSTASEISLTNHPSLLENRGNASISSGSLAGGVGTLGSESSDAARRVTISAASAGISDRFSAANVMSDVGEGAVSLSEDATAASGAGNGSVCRNKVGRSVATRVHNGVGTRVLETSGAFGMPGGSKVHSESGAVSMLRTNGLSELDAGTPLNNSRTHSVHGGSPEGVYIPYPRSQQSDGSYGGGRPHGGSPEGVYIPSPRSHQSDGSYGGGSGLDNSMTHQDHIRSLQQESSATLVAVSPAPRESRSSFEVHGSSKLSLAEAHGKLYDFRAGLRSRGGPAGSDMLTLEANWEGRKRSHSSANLVDVSPRFINVSSAATEWDGELSPREQLNTSVISVGEGRHAAETPINIDTTNTDPHGNHGPADGAVTMATHEDKQRSSALPVVHTDIAAGHRVGKGIHLSENKGSVSTDISSSPASIGDKHVPSVSESGDTSSPPGNAKENRTSLSRDVSSSPAFGRNTNTRSLATCEEQDIGHLRDHDIPSSRDRYVPLSHDAISPPACSVVQATAAAYSPTVTSSIATRTSGVSAGALKAINLPPLRGVEQTDVYVDGRKLVQSLPPLKLLSPLSPHLSDFSLLGKRSRSPPAYKGHRPEGGLALAPPCPPYGVKQPKEVRVLKDSTIASEVLAPPQPLLATAAAKPHLSSVGRRQSTGGVVTQVPPRPASVRSHSLEGMPQELATRLNRSSSTLVLNQAASSRPDSGGRDMSPADTMSPSSPAVGQQFSFFGLPPGPGPLHIAAKCGNLRRLKSLLREGCDVDIPDQEGRTPLMYCIQSHGVHLGCADALIGNGALVNRQSSDGSTAMHLAASIGAVSVIELLLLNGGKVDVQDFEGRSPLHWATLQKGTKTFAVLLKESVTGLHGTDDAGMTVLMWAAYNNNPAIVSYLMDKGADSEEKDRDGYTAMHWAVHKEGSHCLQLLLKPDMTYFKDHRGKTVMHMAAEKGSMSACEVILKLRPDAIHDADKMGRTPLHYAAACSRVDVSALLLDYGADASHVDSTSKTPLYYAREKKLDYVVALLSCHGNAVADFVKASRSASLASNLNRSISFSQLPLPPRTSPDQSSSDSHSVLSQSLSSLRGEPRQGDPSESSDVLNVGVGSYLGRFLPNEQEAVKHYYFRLNDQEGSIYWSRSREGAFKTPRKALVLEVHRGPSNTVKKMPKFSPNDLHCYAFWVATGGGVLDLFAYNEDSFLVWMAELEAMVLRNSSAADREKFKSSSVHSRPSSSLSARSRASVVPAGMSHDDHMTEASSELTSHVKSGSKSGGVDYSLFTVPPIGGSRAVPELQARKSAAKSAVVSKIAQVAPLGPQGSTAGPASSTIVQNFIGVDYRPHTTVLAGNPDHHQVEDSSEVI